MARDLLYGFIGLKDLAAQRVTTVGVSVVSVAIQQSLAEHNRQMAALKGLFVGMTTDFKATFKAPVAGRMQPLDEHGRARPRKGKTLYEVGLPLQMAGTAWGADWVTRQKMTVQEVNDELAGIFEDDLRWVRDHILAALLDSASWTFQDELHGDLTVQPLANGDGVLYPIVTGGDAPATDNHYLADSNAIADAHDPFPTIYSELLEHPGNDRPYIALVPTNLMTAITNLTLFIETAIPEVQLPTTVAQVTARLDVPVPGMLRGFHQAGVWIVEWPILPNNYMTAVAAGAAEKPLHGRQDPEAELQGLVPVDQQGNVITRSDWPWQESQYVRREGFGGWNRVAALAFLSGSSSYNTPADYDAPMP